MSHKDSLYVEDADVGGIDWFENVESNKYLVPRVNEGVFFILQNMIDHYAEEARVAFIVKASLRQDTFDNLNHENSSFYSSTKVIKNNNTIIRVLSKILEISITKNIHQILVE